jgi:hypothetical protein
MRGIEEREDMYANQQAKWDAGHGMVSGSIAGAAGMGLGAAAGYSEPQKREPELPAELTKLAKALEYASHSINELHARLDGKVIRPSAPETAAAGNQIAAVGPCTSFAQEVSNYSRLAHDIAERVQNILNRLEI